MTSPPQFTLGPQTTLDGGRYVLERVLGQGGFGITYRATDTKLGRPVAIKEFFLAGSTRAGVTVQPSPTIADQFRDRKERFRDEARTLARFRHPGIVQVFEFFDENNTVYMVMEHLEGRSLRQVARMAGGMIQEQQAVAYVLQVADALEAVHAEGLLHRDIKPDNVLVLDDGNVVVIDFGTARQFGGEGSSVMSQTLSPGYAPIEQYSERGRFGPAIDVYALGATLYELVTGQMPMGSIDRGVGHELVPPRQVVPSLSPHVEAAILWAMEMDPARRPASAAAFAAALRGARSPGAVGDTTRVVDAGGPPSGEAAARTAAPPPPPPVTAAPPKRRSRTGLYAGIGAGVVAAAVATAALFAIGGDDPDPPPSTSPPPTKTAVAPTTGAPGTTVAATTTVPATTSTRPPPTTSPAVPGTIPADLRAACLDQPLDPGAERIRFTPGGTAGQVSGVLGPGGLDQYVIGALPGQVMTLALDDGGAELPFLVCVEGLADGYLLAGLNGGVTDPLAIEQDYQVNVAALGDGGRYILDIQIPPPPTASLPAGLLCRDLADRGLNYSAAVSYYVRELRPDRMDADLDGIPCETVYPITDLETQYFVTTVEPPGLFCRDLQARGWDFISALAYWVFHGGPDQMDADLDGIPCETVYPAGEIESVLFFDQ